MRKRVTHPETGTSHVVREMTTKTGTIVKTDGSTINGSREDIRTWQYVVATKGLAYALLNIFNRDVFPKIDK